MQSVIALDWPVVVRSKYSCGTAVVLEQTSQSLVTLNGVAAQFEFIANIPKQQLVAFALMISFAVIVSTEFGQVSAIAALRQTEST